VTDKAADEAIALVDARNVMRSRWPNLRESPFVELTRAWAEREEVRLAIVFDGPAPGGLVGTRELDERTTLAGTGGESADDWIAREAPRLASRGMRVWLVSSDRGLRERVRPYVERVIGGGSFAAELGAIVPASERERERPARTERAPAARPRRSRGSGHASSAPLADEQEQAPGEE
jgi:YacP-like NYN domain